MNPLKVVGDAVQSATKKRVEIPLRVIEIEQYSKNIKRFVFADETKVLGTANESGYLKMHFPVTEGGDETKTRSYTIRAVDESTNHVVIDFVCHGINGPASAWAMRAQVGDVIATFGPGPSKLVDVSKDWFLVAGDMTSLPAIAVNLKMLPAHAKGYAIIEIEDESDKQELEKPAGVELDWLVNSDHKASAGLMRDAVQAKKWLDGDCYVWIASEFEVARDLRNFLKEERDLQKGQYYISSYWKLGDTDEGNKRAKKLDGGF